MMIRQRWTDPRLSFSNAANVSSQVDVLEGEAWFADRIWTPNVFVENEMSSSVTKLLRENQLVRIQRDGKVQFNYRQLSQLRFSHLARKDHVVQLQGHVQGVLQHGPPQVPSRQAEVLRAPGKL
jgi:hypothetical protein